MISCNETLKMQKGQSEAVNYRRKDNKRRKRQTMIHKTQETNNWQKQKQNTNGVINLCGLQM